MTGKGYALARAALIRALTAYSGITTTDGAVGGTTLYDSNLIGKDSQKIVEKTILIMSGDADWEDKGASAFDTGTGKITLQGTGFSAQIKAGTIFRILNLSSVEIDVADILGRVDAIKAVTDAIPDAGALTALLGAIASILEDTGTTLPTTLSAIAAYIDTEVAAIKTQTDKIAGKMLFTLDCWSAGLEEVQIALAAGTDALPDIVVADLPAGATVVKAIVMFKFRMIENLYAGINKLDGATVAATSQVIQIRDDTPGAWADAINFVDDFFTLADAAREGGDVIIGTLDVAATVDGNDTYNLQWLLAKADQDFINFNDCQVGLRIWYSV